MHGNDWRTLAPPEIGAWLPTEEVSVVIPAYQNPGELELTLAAVAEQTYPRALLQIVVVDDGSEPPMPVPSAAAELDLVMVRRPRDPGFGAARARNRGAAAADGRILVFLDADTIPDRELVEAHARWHHIVADAATIGFRTHVDVDGVDATGIARAAARGDLAGHFAGREQWKAEWIDQFLERTGQLTAPRADLFKVVTGCNFGLRADTYRAIGGMRVLGVRGVEDTQLGYRLTSHGALLVPDRRAHAWHQGASHFQGPDRSRTLYERRPVMENHIPTGGFRPEDSPRVFTVPGAAVDVPVGDARAVDVVCTCDALLRGRRSDLSLRLRVAEDYPERQYLAHAYASDPRVRVVAGAEEPEAVESAFRVEWPPEALPADDTLAAIIRRMTKEGVGAMHVTVPGGTASSPQVHIWSAGHLARATRVAEHAGEALEPVLAELFGEVWASGYDVGLTRNWRKLCPVCNTESDDFLAHGDPPRPGARCPSCDALERHRLAWLYVERETGLITGGPQRILLTSREPSLAKRLGQTEGLEVTTIEKSSDRRRLACADASFDAAFSPTTKRGEHPVDDLIGELHRVLRPGGWAILLGRDRKNGVSDAADVEEWLRAAGFAVKAAVYAKTIGRAWAERYGIDGRTRVYYCQKPAQAA